MKKPVILYDEDIGTWRQREGGGWGPEGDYVSASIAMEYIDSLLATIDELEDPVALPSTPKLTEFDHRLREIAKRHLAKAMAPAIAKLADKPQRRLFPTSQVRILSRTPQKKWVPQNDTRSRHPGRIGWDDLEEGRPVEEPTPEVAPAKKTCVSCRHYDHTRAPGCSLGYRAIECSVLIQFPNWSPKVPEPKPEPVEISCNTCKHHFVSGIGMCRLMGKKDRECSADYDQWEAKEEPEPVDRSCPEPGVVWNKGRQRWEAVGFD